MVPGYLWPVCRAGHRPACRPLRNGVSDAELTDLIGRDMAADGPIAAPEAASRAWRSEPPLYQVDGLRADPHREMHN